MRGWVGNARFEQADLLDHRLDGISLTAILALNVFHLVDDIPRVLAQLRDLLPQGGLLISQTPCLGERGWLIRVLIGFVQKLGIAPAISELRFAELESLIRSAGFEFAESRVWDQKDATQWIVARKPSTGGE